MRHVRHAKRTPSRMELLARNMRKRGPRPEPLAEIPKPKPVPTGLVFDPVTVPVRKLAARLEDVISAAAVEALQKADPRSSADRYYDARLAELADG